MTFQDLKNLAKRSLAARPWHTVAGRVLKPRAEQAFAGWLDVDGWALAKDGSDIEVAIAVNDKPHGTVTPQLATPYIASMYPRLPKSTRCGFHVTLRQEDMPAGERLTLSVEARTISPNGQTGSARVLQRIPVRHRASSGGLHHRQDYGRVWDEGTRSLSNAQLAVAGTADPDSYRESGISTAHDIEKECGVTADDAVLEIGCGTGRVGLHLAPRCRQWTGSDVSANMLKHAAQTLAGQPNVTLVPLNGVDLCPMPDGALDVVYCTGVFMHLDEWDRYRYVTEAWRVLKPGGRVYFDNMNLLGREGWQLFLKMSGHDPFDRPANISKMSTPDELRTYAANAGFVDTRVRESDLWITVIGTKPTGS